MKMKMKMKISDLFSSLCSKTTAKPPPSPPPPLQPPLEAENRKNYCDNLKERKKLCLVMNLDNTLIDSIDRCEYTKYDIEYFRNSGVQKSFKEGKLHILYEPHKITIKLRPFIRTFLKDIRSRYDVVLYSKRSSSYLDVITKLLNPDDAINLTMISLEDRSSEQRLKALTANKETVVIVDGGDKRWRKKEYAGNVIKAEPYVYFSRVKPVYYSKPWTELKGDECENGGELARVLNRLNIIWIIFYDFPRYRDIRDDVRQIIQKFGCKNCRDKFRLCHDLTA